MHETEAERKARLDRERQQHLKFAFDKRDRLAKELAEIDAYITTEGREYWKNRGYTAVPRIERLRAAILGEKK